MTQVLSPKTRPARLGHHAAAEEVAPNVYRVSTGIANAYMVGVPETGDWVLIDAGSRPYATRIRRAGEAVFGKPPRAIFLTHAHFDHAGGLPLLLQHWNVPVYAHLLELPYLRGKHYPPSDPTVGGFFPQLSRFMYASRPTTVEGVEPFPEECCADVHLPGWELHPTPGHTPGHVSFFDPYHRTLIAGDAVVTLHTDDPVACLTMRQEIAHPPAYATYNWHHARQSARLLAELRPVCLATGHGVPMCGPHVADQLAAFAKHFPVPDRGRYVSTGAKFNGQGPTYIPPAPFDLVKTSAILGTATLAALGLGTLILRWRR